MAQTQNKQKLQTKTQNKKKSTNKDSDKIKKLQTQVLAQNEIKKLQTKQSSQAQNPDQLKKDKIRPRQNTIHTI